MIELNDNPLPNERNSMQDVPDDPNLFEEDKILEISHMSFLDGCCLINGNFLFTVL